MIPKEVLKQIRRIQISSARIVTDVFAGEYHSVFKGKGMEFDEVREYFPGDDIRSIDWNVTARMGHPFIKKFVEERELTVMILLDMSKSSYFGTVNKIKRNLAAEIAAVLAFAAVKNNDKVGLIGFTDKVEIFVPPGKGLKHILRIVREGLYFKPSTNATDIAIAIEYLSKVTTRKTVSFLISDFYDNDFKKPISIANKRHDIVCIKLTDPAEVEMPNVGIVKFHDAESGKEIVVDTSSEKFRRDYKINAINKNLSIKKMFQSINIDSIEISTAEPYSRKLYSFFKTRGLRRR